MSEDAVIQRRLAKIFSAAVEHVNNEWRVISPMRVNFGALMEVCGAFNCKPEELFFNPDLDYSGCYYEGDNPEQLLVFKVVRK